MERFFITSPGTGIGKTLVTAALCWQARQAGKKIAALKPVVSGYDPDDSSSDPAMILSSLDIAPSPAAIEAVSPWRYALPLAPNMAAVREKKPQVNMEALVAFCCEPAAYDLILVEGAGGVMSPLTDTQTMLDWMVALGWPVILVTGSYVGSLSHSLTAMEALKSRGISLQALVISESEASPVALGDTAAVLKKFLPATVSVVTIPRLHLSAESWKEVPSLSEIYL